LIVFQSPEPLHPYGERKKLEKELNTAMAEASAGFLECLSCVRNFLHEDEVDRAPIASKILGMNVDKVRCVDTYTTLLWFTLEVSKIKIIN